MAERDLFGKVTPIDRGFKMRTGRDSGSDLGGKSTPSDEGAVQIPRLPIRILKKMNAIRKAYNERHPD